ncbi:hypothetical protein MMC11_007446 [Xylographa trunciseda]|nr:hypothetical protein [Xylographa trunciseda]
MTCLVKISYFATQCRNADDHSKKQTRRKTQAHSSRPFPYHFHSSFHSSPPTRLTPETLRNDEHLSQEQPRQIHTPASRLLHHSLPRPPPAPPIQLQQLRPFRNRGRPEHIPQRHRHFPNTAEELHCGAGKWQSRRSVLPCVTEGKEVQEERDRGVDNIQEVDEQVEAEKALRKRFAVEAGALVGGGDDGAAGFEDERIPGGREEGGDAADG